MPEAFLAILIHTPTEAAWLASSHSSHSVAEANAIWGRPSSAPMRRRLALLRPDQRSAQQQRRSSQREEADREAGEREPSAGAALVRAARGRVRVGRRIAGPRAVVVRPPVRRGV